MRLSSRGTGAVPPAPHDGPAFHLQPPSMTTMALRGARGPVPRRGSPRPCAPTDTIVTGGSCREVRGSCLTRSWQTSEFPACFCSRYQGALSIKKFLCLSHGLCNVGPVGGPDRSRDTRRAPAREQIREREPRERRRSIERTRYIALLFLAVPPCPHLSKSYLASSVADSLR